jgi:hypothetical protein
MHASPIASQHFLERGCFESQADVSLRRADRRFGHVDLDRVKGADEIELEQTIDRLVDRYHAAREGSAEHKMIIRQLQGVRDGSQLGGLILEEYEMRGEVTVP